jgi:peptidoglycan/xylan/chitin deacetylase (PgdA/CDA1 family)
MGDGGLSVAITFDDGYADNLSEAARLLMRSNTPATFFLTTGYMGKTREFWWDELERIAYGPARDRDQDPFQFSAGSLNILCDPNAPAHLTYFDMYEKLQPLDHDLRRHILDQLLEWAGLTARGRESHRSMTAEEIIRLHSLGSFEIGAHTVTHPVLSAQPLDSQYKELAASKAWLEDLVGTPVASFSYPYGGSNDYTPQTVRAVTDSGFARACSTCSHPVNRTDSPYELPRFNVTDMDGEQFEKFLFS